MYTTLLPLRQTPPEDFESVPVRTVPFAEAYFPDDRASQLQPGFLHVLQALLRSVQPGYILFAAAVFYEPESFVHSSNTSKKMCDFSGKQRNGLPDDRQCT